MGLGDLFKSKEKKAAEEEKKLQAENELTQKLENSSCLKGVLSAIMTNEEHEWLRKVQGSSDNGTRYIEVRPDCIIFEWADYSKSATSKELHQSVQYSFHENGFSPLKEIRYGSGKKDTIHIYTVCRLFADIIGKNITELIPKATYTNDKTVLGAIWMHDFDSGNEHFKYQYTLPKKELESIF